MQRLKFILLFISIACLTGCKSSMVAELIDESRGQSAFQVYSAAKESYVNKNYFTSIDRIEVLSQLYPDNIYMEEARMIRVYCYFATQQLSKTITEAEKFIVLYPNSKYINRVRDLRREARALEKDNVKKTLLFINRELFKEIAKGIFRGMTGYYKDC